MSSADERVREIKIQIGGAAGAGVRPEMNVEDFVDFTDEQIELVTAVAQRVQAGVVRGLKAAGDVAEASVEFGVNVGGEAGIPYLTKGTMGANFKISLTWKA